MTPRCPKRPSDHYQCILKKDHEPPCKEFNGRGVSKYPFPEQKQTWEIIRFSVPAEWSDWAVTRLTDRIYAEEPDLLVMPAGLTIEQRKDYHKRTTHGKTEPEIHRRV